MEENFDFGSRLASLRKEQGWTQRELAEKLYVSDKSISKWERGRAVPDIFYLKKIAAIFSVELSCLVGEEGGRKAPGDASGTIRRWRAVLFAVAVLPLAAAVTARFFLPSTIPAHYGSGGVITRWAGSETLTVMGLVYTAVSFLFAALTFLFTANGGVKRTHSHILGAFLAACVLVFACITAFYAARAGSDAAEAGYRAGNISVMGVVSSICAAVFYIFGAVCMTVRQNLLIGVRTTTTLADPAAWSRVNKTAGAVLSGVSAVGLIVAGFVPLRIKLIAPLLCVAAPAIAVCAAAAVALAVFRRKATPR